MDDNDRYIELPPWMQLVGYDYNNNVIIKADMDYLKELIELFHEKDYSQDSNDE